MKYIKTYETLYFDMKKALNDHLMKFFMDIYSNVPNLDTIPYQEKTYCGFELSTRDENQKVLWCDVNIEERNRYMEKLEESLEVEIFPYNGKMREPIEFIKYLTPPMRDSNDFKGYIKNSDVKKLIKELNKEDYELFISAKKYNL